MANAAGMLKESIWRDKEFRALPRTAQATYAQLISQKELDRAGMQPLQVSKWVKGCHEIDTDALETDLATLEAHRFIFVDEDTDELFIRSYMRHADIVRYPNILKNALRCAGMVASEKLRRELAVELRRLRKADATRVADQIDPDPPNPSETPLNGIRTLPETVPEGLNGSRTSREPQGYGSRSGYLTLGSSSVGEPPKKSQHDKTEPPDPFCMSHPGGTSAPCQGCRAARERRDRWDADRLQAAETQRRQFLADLDACRGCDEHGWALDDDGQPVEPAIRCPNHDWEHTNA